MFEWKVEEMKLTNDHVDSYRGRYKTTLYACEDSVSREDKIAFVDSIQDGKLSYLLSLIEKFNAEKESLPKKDSMFGEPEVKTTSLKAWIKRNDTKYPQNVIDDWFKYGKYNLLGHDEYSILKQRFEEKQNQYRTSFGVSIVTGSCGVCVGNFDRKRDITIDELKELLSKYEQLDALVEKLTEETSIIY